MTNMKINTTVVFLFVGKRDDALSSFFALVSHCREEGGEKLDDRALGLAVRVLIPERPVDALRLLRASFDAFAGTARDGYSPVDEEGALGPLSSNLFAIGDSTIFLAQTIYRKWFVYFARMKMESSYLNSILDMWFQQYPLSTATSVCVYTYGMYAVHVHG